jgi:glycosyltransferase involved in cell wall biosynthesis
MKTNDITRLRDQARNEISANEWSASREIMRLNKVALFIVAYNAEKHLDSLIERIPEELRPLFAEIFIIDDSSTDLTYEVARKIKDKYNNCNINIYRTPFNRGYGGNQKLGYLYCLEKNYDIVILLHGDGQYAPEYIPKILAAFHKDIDAVFASRMIHKTSALRGGMPLYKWVGNRILTIFQNILLKTDLSEFHTGYRAYKVATLKKLPFIYNSDDFHFDTEIIIQLIATKCNTTEIAIPTFYGEEKCHVNGLRYAKDCMDSIVKYHLVNIGLFYSRNYDFGLFEDENYKFKKSPYSLHQYVLRNKFDKQSVTIELGAYSGILSSHIAEKVKEHWAIDISVPELAGKSRALALDLNNSFSKDLPKKHFDCCVALDVIEHLNDPEQFLVETFNVLKTGARLYISTANIAYFPMRILLAIGQFNYGKRGILDKTHKRLFNVFTFKRLLKLYGFKIDNVVGFGPPLTDLISNNKIMKIIERIHAFLSRWYPPFFAYNFLVTATRVDSIDDVFKKTTQTERQG